MEFKLILYFLNKWQPIFTYSTKRSVLKIKNMRSAPVITVPVITLFKLLKYQQLPAAYRTWKPENDRETASFLTGGRNSTLVSTLQVNLSTAVFSCWISTSDGDYGEP